MEQSLCRGCIYHLSVMVGVKFECGIKFRQYSSLFHMSLCLDGVVALHCLSL